MPVEIDIAIDDPRWNALGFDIEPLVQSMVAIVLESGVDTPAQADLSVLLTNDEAVRILNRDFRNKDKPTNILSFATVDDLEYKPEPGGPYHIGDLALALETLEREAAEQEKPLKDHLIHLLVHGTLHLLGYDHQENDEAEAMEALEIEILAGIGIENPYSGHDFITD